MSTGAVNDVRALALKELSFGEGQLAKRKIEAIDQLWQGFLGVKKYTWAVQTIAVFRMDEVVKRIDNPAVAEAFGIVAGDDAKERSVSIGEAGSLAAQSRPWIGAMPWALFAAYSAIVGLSNASLLLLKHGSDPTRLLDANSIRNLIKEALPDYDGDVTSNVYPIFLDVLESKLISELKRVASGTAEDEERIQRARRIVTVAAEVASESKTAVTP